MVSASLYIIACSTRNRVRRWIRRLREPRYLVAVIAGIAYISFVINSQLRLRSRTERPRGGRPPRSLTEQFPAFALAGPAVAGFAVLVVAAGSWLFPGTGTLLDFTRAEVQFLFPAPVSGRKLIAYRMMRSQLGLLFGPLVFAVVVPFGSNQTRVRMAVALWILLFSARAYFSGVALTRKRLTSRDARKRQLARLPLVLVAGALAIAALSFGRALLGEPITSVNDVLARIAVASADGMPRVALWPFTALIRPFFAADWTQFVLSLPGALVVLTAAIAWVLINDQAFEDITREVAEQQRDQPQRQKAIYRARKVGWTLAPSGRAEPAFVWKAVLQTFRVVQIRILVRLAIFVLWMGVVASIAGRGAAATLGTFAMIGVVMSTMIGPLVLRIDLRQDLQHLELLKTWPVRAAELVRGEMLWPAALLSAIAWSMTGLALYLSTAVFSSASLALRVSVAIGVCLVAPMLIAAQLAIHNSAALLFPAWVSFGGWRARGVDAVGQRLIVVGGTTLLVVLAAVPGTLLGGIIWFAFYRFIGAAALVPAAAVCALAIAVEVLLVTEALGPAYERLDLTAIERTD